MADIIVTITGNLTRDAEIKKISEKDVLSFSVACNAGFGKNEQTHFFDCSKWGGGTGLGAYMGKGSTVTVIGRFSENEYKGKVYKKIDVLSLAPGKLTPPEGGAPAKEAPAAAPAGDALPF